MKKFKLISAILVVFMSVMLFSCKKQIDVKNEISQKDFNYVGANHNQGLENSLKFLKSHKNKLKNGASVNEIIEQVDENVVTPFLNSSFDNSFDRKIAIEQKDIMKNKLYNSKNFNGQNFLDSVIENSPISENIKFLLKEIANCNKNTELSCKQKVDYYNILSDSVKYYLTDEKEISFMYSVLSVTISSTEYWNENEQDWLDLTPSKDDKSVKTFWHDLGGADIGGAVVGGLAGLAGLGVAAGPGALGGGLLGSMGCCIGYII